MKCVRARPSGGEVAGASHATARQLVGRAGERWARRRAHACWSIAMLPLRRTVREVAGGRTLHAGVACARSHHPHDAGARRRGAHCARPADAHGEAGPRGRADDAVGAGARGLGAVLHLLRGRAEARPRGQLRLLGQGTVGPRAGRLRARVVGDARRHRRLPALRAQGPPRSVGAGARRPSRRQRPGQHTGRVREVVGDHDARGLLRLVAAGA
mmetsp:Transcript_96116/g.266985  ORF Transcript_96116/g.266985 Transcript_96116/m.266985 type:complete len:213 (+) Transcript_96116:135-773(+)